MLNADLDERVLVGYSADNQLRPTLRRDQSTFAPVSAIAIQPESIATRVRRIIRGTAPEIGWNDLCCQAPADLALPIVDSLGQC